MPATKSGIYHNLKESKYTVSNGEIVFFFSSKLYLSKFMDGYQENRKKFKERLDRLIDNNTFNVDFLSDMNYYKDVEKRGFFVRLKGAKLNWHGLSQYALLRMTKPNTLDWYETQNQK